jgi:hypothetical protein
MARFNVALGFNLYEAGWSENFVLDRPGDNAQSVFLDPSFISLAMAFRCSGTLLYKYTVTNLDVPRQSFIRFVNRPSPNAPAIGNAASVTNTSVKMKLAADDGVSRYLWIKGLIDDQLSRNVFTGQYVIAGALTSALSDYMVALTTLGARIRYLERTTVEPWQTVTQLDGVNDNKQTKVTHVNPPFSAGDRVYFSRIDRCKTPQLTGQHTIISVDAGPPNSFIINAPWQCPSNVINPLNVKVRQAVYQYSPFSRFKVVDISKRATGRSKKVRRGRAASVSCRR